MTKTTKRRPGERQQPARQREPVRPRDADVEEGGVRRVLDAESQAGSTVVGLPDHLDLARLLEEGAEVLTGKRFVLHDDGADHGIRPPSLTDDFPKPSSGMRIEAVVPAPGSPRTSSENDLSYSSRQPEPQEVKGMHPITRPFFAPRIGCRCEADAGVHDGDHRASAPRPMPPGGPGRPRRSAGYRA